MEVQLLDAWVKPNMEIIAIPMVFRFQIGRKHRMFKLFLLKRRLFLKKYLCEQETSEVK